MYLSITQLRTTPTLHYTLALNKMPMYTLGLNAFILHIQIVYNKKTFPRFAQNFPKQIELSMAGLLTCSDFACLLFSYSEKMTYAVQNLSYRNLQLGTQFRICTGFPFQFYPKPMRYF